MSLKHAVLGLLDLSPLTGYDLKKALDESVNHFWTADQAQIYRTLGALVDADLARVDVVAQDGRPDKKIHHLTDAGRSELDRWLHTPPEPPATRNDFLARVFFASRMGDDEVVRLLRERRVHAQGSKDALAAIADEAGPGTSRAERLRLATLRNGRAHVEAELEWLDELEQEFA